MLWGRAPVYTSYVPPMRLARISFSDVFAMTGALRLTWLCAFPRRVAARCWSSGTPQLSQLTMSYRRTTSGWREAVTQAS